MHAQASLTLFTTLVALLTLGDAFKCAPSVPNEKCLSSAHAFSAGLLIPNKTIAVMHTGARVKPASLLARAALFSCAATVPIVDCSSMASAFSASLHKKTATLPTTNITATNTKQKLAKTPCTLTQPYGSSVIILEACHTPPPRQNPRPQATSQPAADYTQPYLLEAPIPGSTEIGYFLLPTPTPPKMRLQATPTGTWTTCVQNNVMTCSNALCSMDSYYAARCTDWTYPRNEGRELCVNGWPSRCEGFHCEVLEEAEFRDSLKQGAQKEQGSQREQGERTKVDGVCSGFTGVKASKWPSRTKVAQPSITCVGSGGAGRGWGDKVWQNGDCYVVGQK